MHRAPHHRRYASQRALSGWAEQAYFRGVAAAYRGSATGQIPELSGPGVSGIGGGVLDVMPGVGTICAWSPPLDEAGNSPGGVEAIEEFARLAGWSVF